MNAPANAIQVPPHLRSTYEMIVAAFPNGVPDVMYLPLLALLADNMSFRGVANVMALVSGNEAPLIYHDVLVAISPNSERKPEPSCIDSVRQLLLPHGYERWAMEED